MVDCLRQNDQIIRCTKCILPNCLPDSNFNENSECKWCQLELPKYIPKGREELHRILEQNRSTSDSADCLVGVSGGKDSSYALYQLSLLGMRVEAFTYVHEGTVNFSLENAIKVCKTLNVKHHIVSLPRQSHIRSFKSFLLAWLDSEDPVAAAMTCVACKHLHIIGTRLAKRRKIPMIIWAECPLEEPQFIPAHIENMEISRNKRMVELGSLMMKKLLALKEFRRAVINNFSTCLHGCLAFRPKSGYLQIRFPSVKQLNFFDYYDWDDTELTYLLINNLNWFVPDSVVTYWHSDCLFHLFKEYMFQKMYSTTYTDAFLSNQIRHGRIKRENAIEESKRCNNYYKVELLNAISFLNLDQINYRIDPSCFDIHTD